MDIRIRRSQLRQARIGGRPLGWVYEYTSPVDIDWHGHDGSVRTGPRAGSWTSGGTAIGDLRTWLRRRFPGAKLVEEWKRTS